jgi:hypothetical protein
MLANTLKKSVAVAVASVFFMVIGVAAYPLHAQEQPGAIEQSGKANVQSGGGSILPIVLIGVGVLAIAAVLIFVVFKTTYDITGSWVFVFTGTGGNAGDGSDQITFTGTKDSGTWAFVPNSNYNGTYTVTDKTVSMPVTGEPTFHGNGTFTAKDTMTGTWVEGADTWSWTATRGTLPASVLGTLATPGKHSTK